MAEKDRFTADEWRILTTAPASAFTAVAAAGHSGPIALFKEFRALAKAMKAAGKDHDWPPVVAEMIAGMDDESKASSPDSDSEDYDGAYEHAIAAIASAGDAAAKLTPEELDSYVKWVMGMGTSTAEAASEKGSDTPISDSERDALAEIERRLRKG